MYKIISVFIFVFIFAKCSHKTQIENPTNLIDEDTFVNVIYDISILEGHMASYNLNQDIYKDSARRMYKGVFEKYEISAVDFKENNDYYILVGKYSDMSKKVLERLKIEEEKYKEVKPYHTISFVQFNQLFKKDNFSDFLKKDTNFSRIEKLDSVLIFYRNNRLRLDSLDIDSLNFELNIKNLKQNKNQGGFLFNKEALEVLVNI